MSPRPRPSAAALRRCAGLLLIPFVLGAAGCSVAASPSSAARTGAGDLAAGSLSGAQGGAPTLAPGAPALLPGTTFATPAGGTTPTGIGSTTGVGSSGAGVTSSNPAMVYPYPVYPGAPGVAPDHTIVVTGTGRAAVKADLSDQATAQRTALAAALADAKAQADVVARAVGVSITGVLSVSVSSGQSYAVPLLEGAQGSAPGAAGGATPIPPIAVPSQPTEPQLAVSVTVAYQIG